MFKSTDAGKTWASIGLKNQDISPGKNPSKKSGHRICRGTGDLFKPTEERGVYRSEDGGKNWKRVLFVNNSAGVVDLAMDPNNPRILIASTWRVKRTPYSLEWW